MTPGARSTAARLEAIAVALGTEPTRGSDPLASLARSLGVPSDRTAYLVLAVLRSQIPRVDQVEAARRRWTIEGAEGFLRAEVRRQRARPWLSAVEVVSGVLVDVTDTSRSRYMTGIQRVARESVRRWPREIVTLVAWDVGTGRLRRVGSAATVGFGESGGSAAARNHVLVPFGGSFVLPEIAIEPARYTAVRTVARHSGVRSVAVGFDCIPITSSEVVAPEMSGAFAAYLAALSEFDVVLPISSASAVEFEGWRGMLRGSGVPGPDIATVDLPFDAGEVTPASFERARAAYAPDLDLPLVLVVGSHEPRKNHVTFLHAAERLWQRGVRFSVVMVGGNAWDTDAFDELVELLSARGRPLTVLSRADDATLWALYRLARFSVFCSLNEGFGLPVAESLASSTPVITSDFGSMRELAESHGGVLVDPSDAPSMAAAMEALLTDDELIARLRDDTRKLPARSWDDYAAAVWARVQAGMAAEDRIQVSGPTSGL